MRDTKRVPILLAAALTASACGLLDVDNPNNLVEQSIRNPSAASSVVSGAQALTALAVSSMWQPYLVASDELFWIGSRDAWLALDQGFVSDPANEFTDAAFPSLGQARWMSDEAVEIMNEHLAEDPSADNEHELARANLFAGIAYMLVGEVQQDFAFSDKTEDGPPVGPDQMYTVLDQAVAYLDAAVSGAQALGDAELELRATAVRARAKFSRAVWDKIKPTPNTGAPLVESSGAVSDALAAIAQAGGVTADWDYDFHYSASTVGNVMASSVNDRKENQIDPALVTLTAQNDVGGIRLHDPIDDVADPALKKRIESFKDGAFDSKGSQYSPLTVVSTRVLHLIVAEDALARGDMEAFTTHVNHVRAMDGLTPFSGQIAAMDMLQHERRVNATFMGLRLADMYRFGIVDPRWQPNGDTRTAPGTLLPITLVEVRANCYLNGLGC